MESNASSSQEPASKPPNFDGMEYFNQAQASMKDGDYHEALKMAIKYVTIPILSHYEKAKGHLLLAAIGVIAAPRAQLEYAREYIARGFQNCRDARLQDKSVSKEEIDQVVRELGGVLKMILDAEKETPEKEPEEDKDKEEEPEGGKGKEEEKEEEKEEDKGEEKEEEKEEKNEGEEKKKKKRKRRKKQKKPKKDEQQEREGQEEDKEEAKEEEENGEEKA